MKRRQLGQTGPRGPWWRALAAALRRAVPAALVLAVSLTAPVASLAADPPAGADAHEERWRADLLEARRLAENDVPRAQAELQRLQERLPAQALPADRVRLLNARCRVEVYLGQTDRAAVTCTQAHDQAERFGDRAGQAEALLAISLNAVNRADISSLVDSATRSLRLLDGIPRPDLLAEAMLRTAMMYRRVGRFDESVAMAVNNMEMAARSSDPLAKAYAHQGLAVSFDQSFRHKEARDQFEAMREQARLVGSRMLEAHAVLGLGNTTAALGDLHEGETFLRSGVSMLREAGAPFAIGSGLASLANNLRLQGRYLDSLSVMNQVVETFERHPNRIAMWFTLIARSQVHEALEQLSRAMADAESAAAIAREIDFAPYRGESAQRLAALHARAGNFQRAYVLAAEAQALAAQAVRERTSDRMVELAERYAGESKQREIDALLQRNREQTAALEQARLRQQWLWSVLAVSGLALAGGALLMLRLRRSRQALGRQSSILQSVLDSMADGVVVADEHGQVILSNPVARQVLGGRQAASGLPAPIAWEGLYLPDRVTPCTGEDLPLSRALRGESCDQLELLLVDPQAGQERWLSASVRPLVASGQSTGGGVVVFADVTARLKSEEALRAREQEFRALVENTPDFVSRFDIDCRRRYVNPALARWLKAPAAALIGLRPSEGPSLATGQEHRLEQRIREVIDAGEESSIVVSYRNDDGESLPCEVRLVPERDLRGEITSVLAIGRDLSRILAAQRRLTTLLENLPDPVARFDPQGRHLYINPALTRIFGLPAERFLGRTLHQLGLDPQARLYDAVRRCLASELPDQLELRWGEGAGERIFECRLVPELDEAGKVTSALGILRELTERRRHDDLVRELGFRREAAREEERKFIARELHDELGQILSALRFEVSALRIGQGRDNPAVGRHAASMLSLVDAVIRVQRDLVHSLRPVALDMGIAAALEWLVGDFSDRHGIPCTLALAEAGLELDADQTIMVFRIVQESLTNALRHARCTHIGVSLARDASHYRVTVEDDGIGFDPQAARSPKSFGLVGLHERAQMLRGRLEIASAPQTGTRIVVMFPTGGAAVAAGAGGGDGGAPLLAAPT